MAGNTTVGAGEFDFSSTGTLVYRRGKSSGSTLLVESLDSSGKMQPLLAKPGATPTRLVACRADWIAACNSPSYLRLLIDHEAFGCLGLLCETRERIQPLIFRRRRIKLGGIWCAQLIYCRSLEDLEEVAAPVGRFLATRGLPLMLVATNRRLRGVPGRFFPEKLPMYFKGAQEPRVGDLSYTEAAVFGM